jgi:putative transposase
MIKVAFTRLCETAHESVSPLGQSQHKHRESGWWQRRFWEHTIRNAADYERHMDYIHYNPIKHGYVRCAHAWPYSSFQACVRRGLYRSDWCCACQGRPVDEPDIDGLDETTGE